jgi:hypothetical protein
LAKWKAHSTGIRTKMGLPKKDAQAESWCDRSGTQLRGVPDDRPRLRDVIDFGYALRVKELQQQNLAWSTHDAVMGLWSDISTGVERLPYRYGNPGTFRQNSISYSYEFDRVLSGQGQMEIMGWPRCVLPPQLTDGQYRSLSGESYSVPVITALNCCLYANPYASWWRQA